MEFFEGTNWTAVFAALITGLVGIVSAFLPITYQWLKARRERKALRAGILAEIEAIAALIRERGYEQQFEKVLSRGRGSDMPTWEDEEMNLNTAYTMKVPMFLPRAVLFQQSLGRLEGFSPGEYQRIVMFHLLLQTVLDDTQPGGALYAGTTVFKRVEQTRDALRQALVKANELRPKCTWWTFCGHHEALKSQASDV